VIIELALQHGKYVASQLVEVAGPLSAVVTGVGLMAVELYGDAATIAERGMETCRGSSSETLIRRAPRGRERRRFLAHWLRRHSAGEQK